MEVRKAFQLIFLMCCAVKINGQEEEPPDLTFLNTEQKAVVRKSKSKLQLVATVAESMASDAYTEVLVASESFRGKLSTVRDKVNNLERRLLGDDDDAEGKAERISGALEGVGEGLVGMIQGIKGGDWVQGVQGALGNGLVALLSPLLSEPRQIVHAQFILPSFNPLPRDYFQQRSSTQKLKDLLHSIFESFSNVVGGG